MFDQHAMLPKKDLGVPLIFTDRAGAMASKRFSIWRLKMKVRTTRHARGLYDAWRESGIVARNNRISRFGMLAEAVWLVLRGRMAVDTYFHYRLFDPKLSSAAKEQYLSEAPSANKRLWTALTPPAYRCLYKNKLVFHRYFAAAGLPLATLFGVYDSEVGRTMEGESLRTESELASLLARRGRDGFAFKPAEGARGHLTLIFSGPAPDEPGKFMTLSGERYDAATIIAASQRTTALEAQSPGAIVSSFLVEERIRSHPELAAFIGGPTLCTARVLTIIALDGSPRIAGAVFKVQSGSVGVDHLLYGAVACWIDPGTGALGPGKTRTSFEPARTIPGTDRPMVGYRLPLWSQVKEAALDAAKAFPWARAIGWDIAISERGPIIIEGNEKWSTSLLQLPAPYGLMTGDLEALYRHRLKHPVD
jgi:hypothetical protein